MSAEAILPMTCSELSHKGATAKPAAAVEPEQGPAALAALIAGVGESTWWRLHSAGKVPRPNKLGGKTLWRVPELREWIAAGCPSRKEWEAMRRLQK
jgi:predicted DNA-binding transcriptional regulator AlpA